jgi:DUF4097 and DUF4098 domain-containing protein YvlB
MFQTLFVSLLLTTAATAAQDDFSWRGALAPGQTIEVKGVNGNIRATETAGGEIELAADRHGRRNNPSEVRIEVVPHAAGITICAVYPSTDANKPNECKPGKEGRNNVRNNDVQVDFTVRVPKGVHLIAHTVNGGVDARGIQGDVSAHSVNGKIVVDAKGNVQAHTVNGGITAAMGDTSWAGTREFHTVNGGITVDLPITASTDFSATVVNGGIESDFPIMVKGKIDPRRLSGTLGHGGRELKLSTVNGSIKIRRIS